MIKKRIDDCLILENPKHKGLILEVSPSGYLTIDNLLGGTQSCLAPQWVAEILGQDPGQTELKSFDPMIFSCLCDEGDCQNNLSIHDDGRLIISGDSGLPQTFYHYKEIVSKIALLALMVELSNYPFDSPIPVSAFD